MTTTLDSVTEASVRHAARVLEIAPAEWVRRAVVQVLNDGLRDRRCGAHDRAVASRGRRAAARQQHMRF